MTYRGLNGRVMYLQFFFYMKTSQNDTTISLLSLILLILEGYYSFLIFYMTGFVINWLD
jgi:hypothetical protein